MLLISTNLDYRAVAALYFTCRFEQWTGIILTRRNLSKSRKRFCAPFGTLSIYTTAPPPMREDRRGAEPDGGGDVSGNGLQTRPRAKSNSIVYEASSESPYRVVQGLVPLLGSMHFFFQIQIIKRDSV